MHKTRVIILEGIATSGKTTLQKLLENKLSADFAVKTFSEGITLMPLVENKLPGIAVSYLQKLLLKFKKSKTDFIITDRFHFTHVFRTGNKNKYFRNVEQYFLKNFNVLTVLLFVNESVIKKNIIGSLRIRKTWAKGKKGTLSEKVAYYKDQQRKFKEITKQSKLPVLKINTTQKNWDVYVCKILKKINLITNTTE